MPERILLVEDDPQIRELLRVALERAGYACLEAEDAQRAYELVYDEKPNLLVLDWMLPGVSGLELLRWIRRDNEGHAALPVILLTAKRAETSLLEAYRAGADDYVRKPFSPRELIARVRAVLSRGRPANGLRVGAVVVEPEVRRALVAGRPVSMSPLEYRLLEFFVRHPKVAHTRERLLEWVWGEGAGVDVRTVDVYVRRLRSRLALADARAGDAVQTVWGVGYRFAPVEIEPTHVGR